MRFVFALALTIAVVGFFAILTAEYMVAQVMAVFSNLVGILGSIR